MNQDYDWTQDVGPGWRNIVLPLIAKAKEVGANIAQVKEKFGGLRFYVDNSTEELDLMIIKAEDESFRTCEYCGQPGRARGGRWIKTLCDEHHAKRNEGKK